MTKIETDAQQKGGAYFPQAYLTDMFRFFSRHRDQIQIITYDDLEWSDDYDYANGYPEEKKRWLSGIKSGEFDSSKAYVLLQYDLDSRPERAMNLLTHAAHRQVPANIMRFAKRVDRRLLKTTGKLEYTDYEIDIPLLNRLSGDGFVLGYHSNCYERSHHQMADAGEVLQADIQALKQLHTINFYTAHGGVPCSKGKNNRDVEPLEETSRQVRWVHNGATPFFNKQFSDGGHNSPQRDPAGRDLRDFIRQVQAGGRYRILVHPQYYDVHFSRSKRYSGTAWYDRMIAALEGDPAYDTWSEVSLQNFPERSTENPPASQPLNNYKDGLIHSLKNIVTRIRRKF